MQATNNKPLRLYCPMNLHPSEILTPDDLRYGDGMVYLCHAIMMRRVQDPRYRKGHRAGFVSLKTQYLRNVIGRHNLAKVKELTIRNGVVQCEESYQAGKHAKGYRVCDPYSHAAWKLREVTDRGLQRRIRRWRTRRQREEWQRIKSSETLVAAKVCVFLHDQLRRCNRRNPNPEDSDMMLSELTDDVIRAEPVLMQVINRHRQLLDEIGWGDAPLTDQYNLATTFELVAGTDD